jgi:hypothetical protein
LYCPLNTVYSIINALCHLHLHHICHLCLFSCQSVQPLQAILDVSVSYQLLKIPF